MSEKGNILVNKITRRKCRVVDENEYGGVYCQYPATDRFPCHQTWHRRTDLITEEEANAQKAVVQPSAT